MYKLTHRYQPLLLARLNIV